MGSPLAADNLTIQRKTAALPPSGRLHYARTERNSNASFGAIWAGFIGDFIGG